MKRRMLDTNIVSLLIREHPSVGKRIVAAPMASLCISSITMGELLFGLARRPEAKRLHHAVHEFLRRADTLPWDGAAAERYGNVRAEMERQGVTLAPLDLLIAAHALRADAILVTNDRAFTRITGLEIEDWAA